MVKKKDFFMRFSNESMEMLLDLIEVKISTMFVYDKTDSVELNRLKRCRDELYKELEERSKRKITNE